MPASMPTAAETFETLVRKGNLAAVVAFLLALPKAELVAVRLQTKALYRQMNDWRSGQPQLPHEAEPLLFLAGLATFSKQEAMGRSFGLPWAFNQTDGPPAAQHRAWLLAVLQHSRPTWLNAWLERHTRANAWQVMDYDLLRELADLGLVDYDPWLFAQALGSRLTRVNRHHASSPVPDYNALLLAQLRADPLALERDIPTLFDFDTPADSAVIWDGKGGAHVTWLRLLPQLAASGHLDRGALLGRCLLALRRDFRRPLLTWFKSIFLALGPTTNERLARQGELVELLGHALPLVVNFALDQLKDLWAAPGFEPAPVLQYAEGLMARQDLKTALRSLLGAFEKLLKRAPALAPAVARLAATALPNADPAVQERAARLLANVLKAKKPLLAPEETEEIAGAIAAVADLLAAPARTLLAAHLEAETTGPASAERAQYVPQTAFQPEISAATAIAPVRDWHELLFLTGQVLRHDDPSALERWLDGLLRLRPQFPADYQDQLRPYLLQMLPWLLRDKTAAETDKILAGYSPGTGRTGLSEMVQELVLSWFLGFRRPRVAELSLRDQNHSAPDPLLRVEQRRLAAVETALGRPGPPLPLLSTPTHAPHWVAPTALADRILTYESAGQLPDTADLAVALARTAIGAAAEVAAAYASTAQVQHPGLWQLLQAFFGPLPVTPAAQLPETRPSLVRAFADRLGRLISYVHQQPAAVPVPLAESLPWLGAVAARTRQPAAVRDDLRALSGYPGLAAPWEPGWHFEQQSQTHRQPWNKAQPVLTRTWTELRVPTEHPGQVPPSPLLLYSLHARLSQVHNHYLWPLANNLPFLLTLLPNNPAPLHWHVLRTACRTNNSGAEGREALLRVLASLLGPGPTFGTSTTLLLAVGLCHAAGACRALALEVLLSAVAESRLEPAGLGQALGRLAGAGFVPVQRLADALAPARAIGPASDDALCQMFEALLAALPAAPVRSLRKLLETYAELAARTRRPVPAPVQGQLREWAAVGPLRKIVSLLLT